MTHLPQEIISNLMAEVIVARSEVIEIQHDEESGVCSHHAAAPLVMQKTVEQPPIGQSGQGIMFGEAGHLQLQQLALGDIGMSDGIKRSINAYGGLAS